MNVCDAEVLKTLNYLVSYTSDDSSITKQVVCKPIVLHYFDMKKRFENSKS
jgi:hypothetical protein